MLLLQPVLSPLVGKGHIINVITGARQALIELFLMVSLSPRCRKRGVMRKNEWHFCCYAIVQCVHCRTEGQWKPEGSKGSCSSSKPADSKAKPGTQMNIYIGVAVCPTRGEEVHNACDQTIAWLVIPGLFSSFLFPIRSVTSKRV